MPYPSLHHQPETTAEWQLAAVSAAGLLMIDDAKLYGFIQGGPEIDRGRCEDILALAGEHGVTVGVDQATEAGIQLIAGWNAEAVGA